MARGFAGKTIPVMTPDQVTEWRYRYNERLGILCSDNRPTPEQVEIAQKEAQEWLAEQDSVTFPCAESQSRI